MEGGITEHDRMTMLRAAVAKVGRDEVKSALARSSEARPQTPKAVGNALNALGKHSDPVGVVDKPQYRAALPFLAALISDACLSRTIEALGDHSDDPTRAQLEEALDDVRDSYPDVTIGVMLASVASSDMPASDLCFDVAATDARFGLAGWAEFGTAVLTPTPGSRGKRSVTPEQREARRLKKQKDADERRKKMEVARKAGEQVRRAKKVERSQTASRSQADPGGLATPASSAAPRLTRHAVLTPAQEEEFDRADPWATGVVFAWVPFNSVDPSQPDLEGKSRRCVVVAGTPTHLLVRPGYSEGGVKSRDWKSVPLRHWKQAGFEQPTWIDVDSLRVPREGDGPVGWLSREDWNALW
jgi:hypothetical protein